MKETGHALNDGCPGATGLVRGGAATLSATTPRSEFHLPMIIAHVIECDSCFPG